MRKMLYTIWFLGSLLHVGCTKDNYIDTGISNGRYHGNLMQYMASNSYDWDSTILLVRHAGEEMVRLFEGKDPAHKEITFFGITNHSIRRHLLEFGHKRVSEFQQMPTNRMIRRHLLEFGHKRVSDLDPEWCREMLLRHVIDGKLYRKDIPYGEPTTYGSPGTGGSYLTTLAGTQIWVFIMKQSKNGVVENAPKPIHISFMNSQPIFAIASGDIEPDNCIVHALEYNFALGYEQ